MGVVCRITLAELRGAQGSLALLSLLGLACLTAPVAAALWLPRDTSILLSAFAPLVLFLFIAMSYLTGPLTRDLANGTTLTLRASAVSGRAIIGGIAMALTALSVVPGTLVSVATLTAAGAWSLPIALTSLVLSPAVVALVGTCTVALALWKGTDLALVVPWIASLALGIAAVTLVVLAAMPPGGWGLVATFGTAAACLGFGTFSAVSEGSRRLLH